MPQRRSTGGATMDSDVTGRVSDHIEVDWPRSIGFFGAIGAAVALDLISMPIALFVASVPFLKLLNRPNASRPQRVFSDLVDGAAKPVGGDSEGTVRWAQRGAGRSRSASSRRSAQTRRRSPARRRSRAAAA